MKVIARNSNLLGKITILIMGIFVVNTALALDGSGTQEDPWRIKSLDDFNDFAADANYWAGFTRLETDVNLAGMVYERAVIAPDVNNSNSVFDGTTFTGVFDGNDHRIINLTVDEGGAGNWYLGLFGLIDEDSKVSNLGLEGGSVSGGSGIGCLGGCNYGSISNCYSTGDVNGVDFVGGLVGGNGNVGSISNCYSTGDVSAGGWVGGLVGNNVGSISNCYSTGDVNGGGWVGGLMGGNDGSISNCYSAGDVNGGGYVGGLVGYIFMNGTVLNCYSTGDVNGLGDVGGLVGYIFVGYVGDCFWDTDTQTHGVTKSIGRNDGTATKVLGLPTAQMQTISTFTNADWDFLNTWDIGENQTYPYLRVYLPSDINKDGIVNFLDFAVTANQWMEGDEDE